MYTAFYGLRDKPFSLTPDPRFLFLAASHREALAHLLFGIDQGEGFIAVTGEVGTGKTTICRTLIERLGSETEVAFVFNPHLDARELLESICLEFGLPVEGRSRRELGDDLNRFLLEKRGMGKRALLIVDEAQNLPPDSLEQIRLLSNLETPTTKLLQILLLGQPELDVMLESHELRQLRQRISVRWRLLPLSPRETVEYVRHRLRIAAQADRSDIFSDRALRALHRLSHGVPRLVNVLCDRALVAGYAAGTSRIGPDLLEEAAREVMSEHGEGGARPDRRRLRWAGAGAAALTALAALALVAVGYALATWGAPASRAPVSAAGREAPLAVPAPGVPDASSPAGPDDEGLADDEEAQRSALESEAEPEPGSDPVQDAVLPEPAPTGTVAAPDLGQDGEPG